MAVAEYRLLIQETDADKTGQLCEDELIRNIERIAETLEKIERKLGTEKPQIMPPHSVAVSQPVCDNHGGLALGEKVTLTLTEAALYTGIGQHKLCELADQNNCEFILWVGKKRLFKRKKLEQYIEKSFSI